MGATPKTKSTFRGQLVALARSATLLAASAGCDGVRPSAETVAVVVIPPVPAATAAPEPASAPPAASAEATPQRSWLGEGLQDDGQRWPMRLTVLGVVRGHCADVSYPPHDQRDVTCTAEWECGAGTRGGVLRAVEHLTSGQTHCIDGCRVVANLTTQSVKFECDQVTGTAHLWPAP